MPQQNSEPRRLVHPVKPLHWRQLAVPAGMMLLGQFLFLTGFMWAALTIGVPTPDATPEQQAYEALHFKVSVSMIVVGLTIALPAMLYLASVMLPIVYHRIRQQLTAP